MYEYHAEVLSVAARGDITVNVDLGFSTWRVVDIIVEDFHDLGIDWAAVRTKLVPHTAVVIKTTYQRPFKRGGKRRYITQIWIDGLYLPDYIEREVNDGSGSN